MLHLHVCPWLVCCSCICHDLRAHLHILLLVVGHLWHEWVFELSFFMSYFFPGLGLAWSWAFPSPILFLPFFADWLILLSCHPDVPIMLLFDLCLLGLFWACCMLSLCLILVTQYYHWAFTHAVLGFLGPFHFLGHPQPIPILHFYRLLLILLGFPSPNYHVLHFWDLWAFPLIP